MKSGKRAGVLLVLLSMLLVLSMTGNVSAKTSRLDVSVEDAFYDDLDTDGIEDDIQIDLTCTVPHGAVNPRKSEFYFTLTMPSGAVIKSGLMLIGKYSEIHIRVFWYDSAWESGWYNLDVDALAFGGDVWGYSKTSHVFDPPTGTGPGEPTVKILIW